MDADHSAPTARVWREALEIPTYEVGEPDANPMFLEKRVYQGSSGAVYPFPVIESVAKVATSHIYDAVFLENEYLKVMVLPELGGRIQMALDKTNNYHFVYYNRVIKPALVGLAGPWISGGIEFNWPQHHRPSTFHPIDCELQTQADGSVTVWCHEIDRMVGTRGTHGLTLYPGRAYIEVQGRVYNRTVLTETFLWWANPAVHVDDNHQSVFPPDVSAVMDHGKRAVSTFPMATGTYYKIDYSPGTDISRYRNIPVPTSYMAQHSRFDFLGSYDHGRQAGLLHVASHHVSPGKKQWTWGHGEFGQAWDRQLTDDDGPYIELMCGVFTDNQPDFTWLAPGEEKSFKQFFMPYKGIGGIKNATTEAAIGLELLAESQTVRATVYTTSDQPAASVEVRAQGKSILKQIFDGHPLNTFTCETTAPRGCLESELAVLVHDRAGRELVSYQPATLEVPPPQPAQAIAEPEHLESVEALYLAGLHLEQYRHATREPEHYFREGLRRDPGDLRCNLALGRLLYRRGLYADAEQSFRAAVQRAARHNSNPIDGSCFLLLGLSLVAQGNDAEATELLHKAAWDTACWSQARFELAKLAMRAKDWQAAETELRLCLSQNSKHHQAVHLLSIVLEELGRRDEADQLRCCELERDPFNFGVLHQSVGRGENALADFRRRMRNEPRNYIELADDYLRSGCWELAADVLAQFHEWFGAVQPSSMVLYHLAYAHELNGDSSAAEAAVELAAATTRTGTFPNSLADLRVLEWVTQTCPQDSRAWCDLGNLLFAKKRYDDAIECWERACNLDRAFAQPRRNLGLAYFNKRQDVHRAWNSLLAAWKLSPADARLLFELDQLAKRLNHDPQERLERLQRHASIVAKRDDTTMELVTLLNQCGQYEDALEVLLSRQFSPWEGGEGKASSQYVLSLVQLGRRALHERRFEEAISHLTRALNWPESLGEGKITGIQQNNIHYWLGMAERSRGNERAAREWLDQAGRGLTQPNSAQFYNDQPPEMIFYQGLAHQALADADAAQQRFGKLIQYAEEHFNDEVTIDFFAVSLPDFLVFDSNLQQNHRIHCRFMRALGLLGLEMYEEAQSEFSAILVEDRNHLGAIVHQSLGLLIASPEATIRSKLIPEPAVAATLGAKTKGGPRKDPAQS